MRQTTSLILVLILLLAACSISTPGGEEPGEATSMDPGMGPQSGMMARHSAPVPEAYAGLSNPVAASEDSLERGAGLFATHCASCHGDGGMGDGPASAGLDPAPSPIAHTSQMMSDGYLFWRISEGGTMAPFHSTMPAWKGTLEEQARWDVINYIRALGSGAVTPRQGMGGAVFDPAVQAARQAEMLATAVTQGVLTQAEADVFAEVHAAIETLQAQGKAEIEGNAANMQEAILAEHVQAGTITQAQANAFNDIHNRLLGAGLME